jgi:hypothetical protein
VEPLDLLYKTRIPCPQDMTSQRTPRFQGALFAATLALAAVLAFSVQPMVGRMMLPHVGGAPAGWVVALAFFQAALLAGYGLTHLLSRLSPLAHGLALLALLALAGAGLPVAFATAPLQEGITPWGVFVALALSVGVPFVALSALAPGLQRLFTAAGEADPYHLYAASNAGSVLGLLGYPLLVEPWAALPQQAWAWALVYGAVGGLVAACIAWPARRGWARVLAQPGIGWTLFHREVTWRQRAAWLALAAVPASLIAGVSAHITQDVAAVPMLWVVPLALYLTTHILAFARSVRLPLAALGFWQPFGVALLLPFVIKGMAVGSTGLLLLYIGAVLVVFFVTALALHGRLVALRPPARHLTDFYLMLALGGALGGAFNAFIAPLIFTAPAEFPGALLLSVFLMPRHRTEPSPNVRRLALWGAVAMVVCAPALLVAGALVPTVEPYTARAAWGVFAGGAWVAAFRPRLMAAAGLLVAGAVMLLLTPASAVFQARNVFGVSTVYDAPVPDVPGAKMRVYKHGSTVHGMQIQHAGAYAVPLTYYAPDGPLDSAFAATQPGRVLVMGLGAGSTACYARLYPDATIDFVDIDPLVVRVAREHFTFLDLCPPGDVFLGDARLVVEGMPPGPRYDLMVIDTFSSDAIPAHIITLEALMAYRARMAPDGVILVHISNRYLDLRAPLAGAARALGLAAYGMHYTPPERHPLVAPSEWVALTPPGPMAQRLDAAGWLPLPDSAVVWSDAYTDLVRVVKFGADKDFARRSAGRQAQMEAFIRAGRPVKPVDFGPEALRAGSAPEPQTAPPGPQNPETDQKTDTPGKKGP